jgi:hypothetical protein
LTLINTIDVTPVAQSVTAYVTPINVQLFLHPLALANSAVVAPIVIKNQLMIDPLLTYN